MATTTMTQQSRFGRRPLAALGKLTLAVLIGTATLIVALLLALDALEPTVLAIPAIPLIAAGVVAMGWRWAPLLGTLITGLLLLLLLGGAGGEIVYTMTHSGSPLMPFVMILIPLLAVGFGTSIGATVQNYRGAERRAPRWLAGALLLVAGLGIGAAAISAIPQAGDPAGLSAGTLAALPAVTLASFDGGTIRVKAGETVALRLENPDPVVHAFVVDELGVNAPMLAGKQSLALFKPTAPGTYTFYCTPHYNKATGQGMHGTLIVAP
jgi:heme/copper-type cytochrome/quinol oxidase subunit 2